MYKMLIVDDEAITRSGLMKHIPFSKYEISYVEQTDDGLNALKAAQRFQPDIVLSDIKMPRMDGITFADELKKIQPNCQLIFMSAYSDKEYFKKAIALKAVGYVEKPIDLDELEVAIKHAVDDLRQHSRRQNITQRMDKVLEESRSLFSDQLALLLAKHTIPIQELKGKIALMNIDIPVDGYYVTMLIKLCGMYQRTPRESEQMREQVFHILQEISDEIPERMLWSYRGGNQIVLHLCVPREMRHRLVESWLLSLGEKIYLSASMFTSVSVSIGSTVQGIENISQSYICAAVVMQRLFFKAGTPVACYNEDKSVKAYTFSDDLFEQFGNLLEKGQQVKLVEFVRNLSMQVSGYTDTCINTIKNMYYKLICETEKYFEHSLEGKRQNEGDLIWNVVASTETLEELAQYLVQKIHSYFRMLHEQDTNDAIAVRIQKYISLHYHDSGLSIETIGKEIGMSPAYLCVLFKSQTGTTINAWITDIRMKKAKELLRDAKVKISELAKGCGYNDPDYFAKVFKKSTDCSPSEYRRKYIV